MRSFLLFASSIFICFIVLTSCGLNCIDTKTGIHKSSQSLHEAEENKVFKCEFISGKTKFQLDNKLRFEIKNAWTENRWMFECIDNSAEVVMDSSYQFVIDGRYEGDALNSGYSLEGIPLGAVLNFDYKGQDTIKLTLYKQGSTSSIHDRTPIDTLTFIKRTVSR